MEQTIWTMKKKYSIDIDDIVDFNNIPQYFYKKDKELAKKALDFLIQKITNKTISNPIGFGTVVKNLSKKKDKDFSKELNNLINILNYSNDIYS